MILNENNYSGNESIGQIFTPNYIAKFMVNNVLNFLGDKKKKPCDLKVLEPSVGEGIFLKYLIKNNFSDISAYEIDDRLKDHLLSTYSSVKFKFENFLGSKINEKFDLIVGNPPYLGQNYNAEIFQDYVKKYPVCEKFFVGNMDIFYYFIHLGILKLNPGGFLSFITTNYWITKSEKTGIKLLKPHILDECNILQYIDLANMKLFPGAKGQNNCIFILEKKDNEKLQNNDKEIDIIKIGKKTSSIMSDYEFNKKVFVELYNKRDSEHIRRYKSALTNKKLERTGSWKLSYPRQLKTIIELIEDKCKRDGKTLLLKDLFIVRNGIIFIKDDIFILKEGKNLKIKNGNFFILINKEFFQLNEKEISKLKKIFKSKVIKPYGHDSSQGYDYAIYFNTEEIKSLNHPERISYYELNYPNLSNYILQFKNQLQKILINAREKPENYFYPRRGAVIRGADKDNKEILINLENKYDAGKKIFIKFITQQNEFGYSDGQYYATSDTYFLWPKVSEDNIDYPFMLAYLNSKLIYYIFKIKSIKIKRSKTKLENEIAIPNKGLFCDPESMDPLPEIRLIRTLSRALIEINSSFKNIPEESYYDYFFNKIDNCDYFYNTNDELKTLLLSAIAKRDENFILKIIDSLFFELFGLEEEEIDKLIETYYEF
ncbi:MAG: hypothetical protein EU540_02440 [Promethearchaeota archaeon]|nr:MAG: hypothetical protein EU540_02440 [Candidatus Lokiarchaeota archaeon]